MLSKRDKELLINVEFEIVEGCKFYNDEEMGELGEKGEWVIYKDRKYVKRLWEMFDEGHRICMMNGNRKGSYILENIGDDGVWVCKDIDECLDMIDEYECEEEEEDWVDEIKKGFKEELDM